MIVVAGEALIDRIVGTDGSVREVPGGGPVNTARAIARLGAEVAFLGRLSADDRGVALRATLARDGVDLRWAPSTGDRTTQATATLDAAGNAAYVFDLDGTSAAGLTAMEVDRALTPPPVAFHVGTLGLVMEPIADALATAVDSLGDHTLVMVDPNCRPATITDVAAHRQRIDAILARADVVKVSHDDLAFLRPDRPPYVAAHDLLSRGAGLVLVTDGPHPVAVHTPTFEVQIEAPHVPVVDTVGAGDAFGGAFLAWWVGRGLGRDGLEDGAAIAAAVRFAIAVAALTVGRAGADPPIRAEVEASGLIAASEGLAPLP